MNSLDGDYHSQLLDALSQELNNNGISVKFLHAQELISKSLDYDLILKFCNKFKKVFDNELFLNSVVLSNNPKTIFEFAKIYNGNNFNVLTSSIAQTNNPEYIYLYSKTFMNKNIDLRLLASSLAKTGDAQYIYMFCRYVSDKYIDLFSKPILESNNGYFIYEFAKEFRNKINFEDYANAVTKSKEAFSIVLFAREFQNQVNLSTFAHALVCSPNNANHIETFAQSIKNGRKLIAEAIKIRDEEREKNKKTLDELIEVLEK